MHKFKWVWDGQCRCVSEQTGVMGNSRHYDSRNGAAKEAVRDYFIQGGHRGLFTDEQLSQLKQ